MPKKLRATHLLAVSALSLCTNDALAQGKQFSLMVGGATANSVQLKDYEANAHFGSGGSYTAIVNIFQKYAEPNVELHYEFLLSQNNFDARLPFLDESGQANELSSDLTTTHAHVGGTYEWALSEHNQPYVGATLGASHVSTNNAGSDTFWGFSVAGGTKIGITNNLAARLEARAFAIAWDSNSAIFCTTYDDNFCSIYLDASLWWQYQVSAGLTYSF